MADSVQKQIRDNLSRLIRQEGSTLNQNDDGGWIATVPYVCSWDKLISLLPKRYTGIHPDFSGMKVDKVSATKQNPGIARVVITYVGNTQNLEGPDSVGQFEPVEELVRSLSQEPIETHSDFDTVIAGTPENPENGAIFIAPDEKKPDEKVFVNFKAGSRHSGLTAFLSPGATYNRSYITESKPVTLNVGAIEESPPGAPSVGGSYNWLTAGQSWRRQGGIYNVSDSWMLSAKKGWDDEVYD